MCLICKNIATDMVSCQDLKNIPDINSEILNISACPKLRSINSNSVKRLYIENCHDVTIKNLSELIECTIISCSNINISLNKKLVTINCVNSKNISIKNVPVKTFSPESTKNISIENFYFCTELFLQNCSGKIRDMRNLKIVRLEDTNLFHILDAPRLTNLTMEHSEIKQRPYLPSLFNLTCNYCYIEHLPVTMSVRNILLNNCYGRFKIPQYRDLNSIELSNVKYLTEISGFKKLRFLVITDCRKLTTIENNKNLQYLSIIRCPRLDYTKLSNNQTISTMRIIDNGIDSFPPLNSLTKLSITNSSITKLPELKNAQIVDCCGCTKLKSISLPDTVTYLHCTNCIDLETIDEIRFLETLVCVNCPKLKSIPYFPYIKRLVFNNSRLLTTNPNISCKIECDGCVWSENNNYFSTSIRKLKIIQRFVRANKKRKIFKKWIKSEEFAKWFYSPEQLGGRISKLAITNSINRQEL